MQAQIRERGPPRRKPPYFSALCHIYFLVTERDLGALRVVREKIEERMDVGKQGLACPMS